jgi:hypothetical protein
MGDELVLRAFRFLSWALLSLVAAASRSGQFVCLGVTFLLAIQAFSGCHQPAAFRTLQLKDLVVNATSLVPKRGYAAVPGDPKYGQSRLWLLWVSHLQTDGKYGNTMFVVLKRAQKVGKSGGHGDVCVKSAPLLPGFLPAPDSKQATAKPTPRVVRDTCKL